MFFYFSEDFSLSVVVERDLYIIVYSYYSGMNKKTNFCIKVIHPSLNHGYYPSDIHWDFIADGSV
jgi:hypothetical protein